MSQLLDHPAAAPGNQPPTTPQPEDPSNTNPEPRRIAASRANGALSSGPTTEMGKLASANASKNLRHGMLAQTVVLASESRDRFEDLLNSLLAEHRPTTRSQRALVDGMAVARWRQMRTWTIQKNDFDREISRHQAATPTIAPVAAAIAFRSLNEGGNSLSIAIKT